MSTLELRGLRKRFGPAIAVDGVDLEVAEGEFCVLLGPSGCGKSTILRCIAGLETPDSGSVHIGGRVVDDLGPRERNIAMVFQSYALYPHMTVRENISFPLRMRRVKRPEVERRVADTARLLHIEGLLGRRPRELSGGERQRVAIGRAIVREPDLFLFDEPLSNLDARLRGEMRLEIARIHRTLRIATVYVTHDQVEAMTLGSKIAVCNHGRIEQIGPPGQIYERPATLFVAGFVGQPPMNFLAGRVEAGLFATEGLRVPVGGGYCGEAVLGIRPEDVRLDGSLGSGPVERIEYLGSDRFAHVRIGAALLVARIRPGADPSEGDAAGIGVDPGRLHLFAGGLRVGPG